jgi:hypothetical protein
MAILGQSAKSRVDQVLNIGMRADYVVSNAINAPFSAAVATRIATVPGVLIEHGRRHVGVVDRAMRALAWSTFRHGRCIDGRPG